MFEIGFSELVLLMVVGLVVLGPKRLPIAIKTVMSWVHTVRGLAANVQNELKQELKLQELQESIKKAENLNLSQLSPELHETLNELKQQADLMRTEIETQAATSKNTVQQQIQAIKNAKQAEINPEKSDLKSPMEEEKTFPNNTPCSEQPTNLTERLADYYPADEVEITVNNSRESQ